MEFIGRAVRREIEGSAGAGTGGGVISGVVKSYESSSGLFQVVYEDGDSEELGWAEVSLLVEGQVQLVVEEEGEVKHSQVGRKPKKRRRLEGDSGNAGQNFVIDETLGGDLNENGGVRVEGNLEMGHGIGGNSGVNGDLNGDVSSRDELGKTLVPKKEEGLKDNVSSGNGDLKDGFDLNAGFNLNLNDDDDDSNVNFNPKENLKKRNCIDLNLDVNGEFDENLNADDNCRRTPVGTRRRECNFDLNLEVVDDVKEAEGEAGGEFKVSMPFETVGEGQTKEGDEGVEEKTMEDIGTNGSLTKVHLDMNEDINASSLKDVCTGSVELLENDCSGSDQDGKPHASVVVLDTNSDGDCGLVEVPVRDGFSEAGTQMIYEHLDNSGSPLNKKGGRRKRRKLSDNIKSPTETVLRRSARRGSAQNHVSITLCTVNDAPSSPAVSAITEEKPGTSVCKESEKPCVMLPPKLQLPPSSQNIDLTDIPILDLFSVYACIRSFSTLLFLSPFELEDFVAALKCKFPSSLFDNVHVTMLQTLRKHLEYLANEGSESASDCLRSLNWDFLDLITWPIFMVEYFLIHGSGLKPSFDLSSLKLFKADYYQQPASIKVEILRCLCDDLIEVEAIRSELNRRSLAAEPDMVFERNFNFDGRKKRRVALGISSSSCLDDEVVDDTVDRNYDECCLCRMDGSLICCDGCPAAFHSRCVGVSSDHLPEGDWYCPECVIDRNKPWMKLRKSLRGAELLGIDPHGRLYFNSSGYLLVSDSFDTESSFSYYHRDDLNMVVEVLKLSDFYYGDILVAICKHWGNVSLDGTSKSIDCLYAISSDLFTKSQNRDLSNPSVLLTSPETCDVKNETCEERKMDESSKVRDSGPADVSKSVNMLDATAVTGSSLVTSEGSAETQSDIQGKNCSFGDCPLTSTLGVRQEVNTESVGPGNPSTSITTRKGNATQVQRGNGYVNYYTFGQIASSVAEDLTGKSSEKIKEDKVMSEEEIISRQMRAIVKKFSKFCWSNIQSSNVDLQKEKCGWCYPCRVATDDRECLFFMNVGPVGESPNSDMLSLQSKKSRKSHLTDVICQILSIENRLHGLLLGPWLNPNHTKLWHKSALKASDIASVKHMLLTLESNLGRRALSAEWLKHVDSDVSMGSASHIVINSARGSSKHMIGRKRPKFSDIEPGPTLNTASGLGMLWWRGGRLSRQLFNWKVLPHSLVSKAARQGGCAKIPGILYPENSEHAKRSKYVVWQAAVETSTSAEQLAFQVRELDSNIKWDDVENTHPLPALDKESRKSIRLFKKVIIRRKCIQGGLVKYLLDFGKRRAIPDVVKKHGSVIEESSSDRKKYWLDESYVPLHLLKNFEEKRVARKANDMKPGKVIEPSRVMKRPQEKRGFAYLFAKAERSEYYQCGHCSKDVLIREAVSCQYCKGFFHKRHVRKSAGAIIAKCTYTCHRCQNGMRVNIDTKKGKADKRGAKLKSQKSKSVQDSRSSRLKSSKKVSTGGRQVQSKSKLKATPAVPLRRSARKAKCLVLQKKKHRGRRKGKQAKSKTKSKKGTNEKPKKVAPCRKKRTEVSCSYWLNGLQWARNPDDERVLLFRDKNFVVPSEQSHVLPDQQPKCQLCDEGGHTSNLSYIACQICGDWFHGDAFGVHTENIDKLIGFRCHTCRESTPPVCPQSIITGTDMSQLAEVQKNAAVECTEEISNAVPPLSEVACN